MSFPPANERVVAGAARSGQPSHRARTVLGRLVKSMLDLSPGLRSWIRRVRADAKWLGKMKYMLSDAAHVLRFMSWRRASDDYWKLSAELLFQYHKLEKGLCMPGDKRFFGRDPIRATVALIERWRAAGLDREDPIYSGALEAVHAYGERLAQTPPPPELLADLSALVQRGLDGYRSLPDIATPMRVTTGSPASAVDLDALFLARRSVRNFREVAVPLDLIGSAVAAAQLSPSACNRQPWKVHVYQDAGLIREMLALQNGNAGFGHRLRVLLVIAADSKGFFDASERHQAFVDAGLFTMSLLLALQARGLGTCCLNWCVDPVADRRAHEVGGIPDSERIIMYLAVGVPESEGLVPRSPRRGLGSVIHLH